MAMRVGGIQPGLGLNVWMLPIPTLHPLDDATGRTSWTTLYSNQRLPVLHECQPKIMPEFMKSIQFPANIVNFCGGFFTFSQKILGTHPASSKLGHLIMAGTALVVFICAVAALAVTAQQPYPELPEVFPLRGWKLRESRRVLMQTLEVKRLLPPGNEPMVVQLIFVISMMPSSCLEAVLSAYLVVRGGLVSSANGCSDCFGHSWIWWS